MDTIPKSFFEESTIGIAIISLSKIFLAIDITSSSSEAVKLL